MADVDIIDLSKIFHNEGGDTLVLTGINLTIHSGEPVAIVGPSGAGKSTLLSIIGSLENPTTGKVCFDGEDIFAWKGARLDRFRNRQIGFVFQFHHLIDDFTALENVMLPLLIRADKAAHARERARVLINRLGLSPRENFLPRHLSGGEQQRVAIARALVGEPLLVLADEPTGNLDRENSRQIFDLLLELNHELKTTLVVVTHNEQLARNISRQVTLIDGKIQPS